MIAASAVAPACRSEYDWPAGYPPFHPRRWLSNPHLQTIFGNFLPRRDTLPLAVSQLVEVSPAHGSQIATRILCECNWRPLSERAQRPTAIILHGLEGSSRSQYVIGNANKLWSAGCNVVRMNMRNCGGTEALSPTLYHSGLSCDVDQVLRYFIQAEGLQSVSLIGYSMGGNLILKLAGELATSAPPQLRSIVGVSPAVDLAVSADALHEPLNRIYERKFLRALLRRFRRKAALFPQAFDARRADHITSLRQFDDCITALYSGFQSADDYYFRAAAAGVIGNISVPTLFIHADDDPFVRITPQTRSKVLSNPNITLLETAHGGHCAFLAAPGPATDDDGYWAEHTIRNFVLAHA